MLQPRCPGVQLAPLRLASFSANARAGPSNYRFSKSLLVGSGPSVRLFRGLTEQHRQTHTSAPPEQRTLRYASTALTAAPVASSPIPDTITQLLLASPLSPGWTIILLTLFCRSTITLPMTLWQRRRLQRTRKFVLPQMREYNEKIALSLVRESRAAGKTYEEYRKSLKDALAGYQSNLHKKYKTHPLPTMLVPLGVHIPLLIGLSLTIRKTVEMPGGWGEASFWWLDKLGEVDATGVLPILGGLVAFANAEVVGRKVKVLEEASTVPDAPGPSSEAGAAKDPLDPPVQQQGVPTIRAQAPPSTASSPARTPKSTSLPSHLSRRDASHPQSRELSTSATLSALPRPRAKRSTTPITPPRSTTPQPRLTTMESPEAISAEKRKAEVRTRFISNVMRIGAVLFIPIAAQVPSGLALYWTVSMCFTFVQNLFLNRLDAREAVKS